MQSFFLPDHSVAHSPRPIGKQALATGYRRRNRTLTPRQLSIVYDFLGEPG